MLIPPADRQTLFCTKEEEYYYLNWRKELIIISFSARKTQRSIIHNFTHVLIRPRSLLPLVCICSYIIVAVDRLDCWVVRKFVYFI